MKTLQAYKRSPALENSTWYKGLLISQLAGSSDTDGAFDLVESKMKNITFEQATTELLINVSQHASGNNAEESTVIIGFYTGCKTRYL